MKKGILLTLGLFLIATCILALALLINNVTNSSEERVAELSSLNRVYDLYESTEQGFKEIFDTASIKVDIGNSIVTFEEPLPNNNADEFKRNVSFFENFLESNFKEIKIEATSVKNNLPLVIKPQNITYTHPDGFGGNKLQIIPERIDFDSYAILTNSSENVTALNFETSTPGSFRFSVTATDNSGNLFSQENFVDISKTVEVDITLISGKKIEIDWLNGVLNVVNDALYPAVVRTSVGFNATISSSITYLDDIIQVNYESLGVLKNSTVTIL